MKKCKRCSCKRNLTRHHIYPRKWNKDKKTEFHFTIREKKIILCRNCHDKIERIIFSLHEVYGKLPERIYFSLANNF